MAKPNQTVVRPNDVGRVPDMTEFLDTEIPPTCDDAGDHGPQHTYKGVQPNYIDSAKQ
jgi:hypothetical protein